MKALSITEELRASGIYAECDIVGRSLKAQMKYADKLGAEYTLILGDSELEAGLTPTAIALDGIAVIVNNESEMTGLTSEQVRAIFMGETTDWNEVK